MSFFIGHGHLLTERLSRKEADRGICTTAVSLDDTPASCPNDIERTTSKLSSLSLVDIGSETTPRRSPVKRGKSLSASEPTGAELPPSHRLTALKSNEIKSIIPDNWTVCGLSISPDSKAMVVSRLTKSRPTLVWTIPFPLTTNSSYQTLMNEFQALMDESKETIQKSGSSDGEEHRSAWWKKRTAQNEKLQKILNSIENDWFGPWKGIFLGIECSSTTSVASASSDSCSDITEYIRVIQGSYQHLSESQVGEAIDQITNAGVYDYATVSRMAKQPRPDIAEESNAAQPKPPTQKRAATRRTVCTETRPPMEHNPARNSAKPGDASKRGPVILILDEPLHQIPWESLPIISSAMQPVTRLPSWAFLQTLLQTSEPRFQHPIPRPRTVGYVLDPAGDLVRTRQMFQPIFESQKEWRGFVGHTPKSEECRNLLETCDAYIYCGHNAGEQFLSGQDMRLMRHCCPTLLIGCSSGALKLSGAMEPKGAVLDYLLAGCPAVIANLWDVTDRDIDRFGKHLIESQFMPESSSIRNSNAGVRADLAAAVQSARQECRMRFIIGAAPVYYGLPLKWAD